MSKNILLLDGNPKSESFSNYLADLYEVEAHENFTVKRLNLSAMAFNPSLENGYNAKQPIEPCLTDFQNAIVWADHLVIIMPIWWGGLPAKLKGLFDRAFLPCFAFKYDNESPFPTQLLKGKTSHIIMTMDAPKEFTQEQAAPAIAQLDQYTLQFCGFEKAHVTLLGSMISASKEDISTWSKLIQALAVQGQ